MEETPILPPEFLDAYRERLGIENEIEDHIPPVFIEMEGRILAFDQEAGTMEARFPVLTRYQNPFKYMQGGMIAAAIDNTFGPLSFLVAPPSVTRNLEVRYRKAVTEDHAFILVKARVEKREGAFLYLSARVENDQGELVAVANARHYIVKEIPDLE
jgi:acyl-coenzyme A thioesterase PaaI-like protein